MPSLVSGNFACKLCNTTILEARTYSGYVYVLSNQAMPTLSKIGSTERDVNERIKELDAATGIPTPFVIEACFLSEDHVSDERRIHDALILCRINPNREFFQIAPIHAISKIANILKRNPCYYDKRLRLDLDPKRHKCEDCGQLSNVKSEIIFTGRLGFKCAHCGKSQYA